MQLYVRVLSILIHLSVYVSGFLSFSISVSTWSITFLVSSFPFWSYAFLWHIKPYGFDLPFYIFFSCLTIYTLSAVCCCCCFFSFFHLSFKFTMAMYLSCIYCYIWNLVRFTLQCRYKTFTQLVPAWHFFSNILYIFYRSIVDVCL